MTSSWTASNSSSRTASSTSSSSSKSLTARNSDAAERPVHTLSLEWSFAYLNYGHRERQHMFRFLTKAEGTFYFQAISSNDAALWYDRC